jgi:hypothetical protein
MAVYADHVGAIVAHVHIVFTGGGHQVAGEVAMLDVVAATGIRVAGDAGFAGRLDADPDAAGDCVQVDAILGKAGGRLALLVTA